MVYFYCFIILFESHLSHDSNQSHVDNRMNKTMKKIFSVIVVIKCAQIVVYTLVGYDNRQIGQRPADWCLYLEKSVAPCPGRSH